MSDELSNVGNVDTFTSDKHDFDVFEFDTSKGSSSRVSHDRCDGDRSSGSATLTMQLRPTQQHASAVRHLFSNEAQSLLAVVLYGL